MPPYPFSPLFIGVTVVTILFELRAVARSVFQSPFHRGNGCNDGQDGDGGGETEAVEDLEEAVTKNYSTVEDLNTNIKQLNDSVKNVTSGNLNPALGPTPAVDIPDVLDRLLEQTGTASPTAQRQFPGFGEALSGENQFRQGAGGGSPGAQQAAALRVAFPREALTGIANIAIGIIENAGLIEQTNLELLALRTFVENGLFPALHDALTGLGQENTLQRIAIATETTAQVPLVQALRDAGVGNPFSAGSPTPDMEALQAANAAGLNEAGFALLGQLSSIGDQSETAKGLDSIRELMSLSLERPAGTSGDPLYVTMGDETVKVEGTVEVVGGQMDVQAEIVNESAIPVAQQGEITVIVGNTPLTVNISDLGTLISQLSAGNTARDSFGGQTI